MTTMTPQTPDARLIVRLLLRVGEATYELGDAEMVYELPAMRALLTPTTGPEPHSSLPPALHERIATLCARLGVAEPSYSRLEQATANALLARLQAEEEDLLRTAEGTHVAPSAEPSSPIDKGLVRQLKARWRARTKAQGPLDELRRAWEGFKQGICGEEVADRAMREDQYVKLLAFLTSPSPERTRR